MYKMLAIDIDDTLINDDKQITEGTRQALTAALSQGVIVTLATGRMYASAKQVAEQLELNVPLITYQGSLVKNALDGRVLYERAVPEEDARRVFEYCTENGLHLQTYLDDKLYVKEQNDKVDAYSKLTNVPYHIDPGFEDLASKSCTKLLMIGEPDQLDREMEKLRTVLSSQVHLTKSKPHYLEVIHGEGTKGHALAHLADHFGLELSQTIAIGDSWNDREMLQTAGLGVAMGNAVEALKEIAGYVTYSNNEDGIKHVIEKFILRSNS